MSRFALVVLFVVLVAGVGVSRVVPAGAAEPGDPETPIPVGVEAPIGGGWFATVPAPATDVSEGLPGGPAVDAVWTDSYRYLLIPVRLVYRGDLPMAFAFDQVALSAETWEDNAYATYPSGAFACLPQGAIPDAIDLGATRAPTDAPIDGTICVEVDLGDERPLFLRVQGPDSSVSVVYFAVTGVPGEAATPPATAAVGDGGADPSATTVRPPLAGSPESPATVATGGVRQTTWGDNGLPLADAAGEPSGWALVSIRMAENAVGMTTMAEVRNDGLDAAVAPSLTVEVLREGTSYGATELIPINGWAPTGGSAYYMSDLLYADELYDGTVTFGGWDEERYSARDPGAAGTRAVPGLRLDGGTVTNVGAGEEPLGGLLLVVRDRAGVFSGGCVAPGNGQLLAPGSSIAVPEPLAAGELPDCPPADRGMAASESLRMGGPYAVEVVLA